MQIRTLRIIHRTRYTYDLPVAFGEHRLMIRPRDGHDMRLLDSSLTVSPRADVHWAFDAFGNSLALLLFHDKANELVIESELLLRRYGLDEPLARIARYAGAYPVQYGDDDRIDLGPYLRADQPQDQGALAAWIAQVLPQLPGGSLQVLGALATAVHKAFRYVRREEEGVQTPAETIRLGTGTCRDFALLFMEAARILGFAARFVTGYLHDEAAGNDSGEDMTGGGATHAWADIFVPGAGWVEFDPTNRIIASRNLIRVATTRTPSQAMPVSGTFVQDGGKLLGLQVSVSVTNVE
ncbi:MAG: transglutaminase family protein [Oceanibaculum nanhaiense]|uniref:transglutaminase family protein n=1 Tax=Oceanibaculum nanhaiense TaxID=1909734 RepID=UPI0032EBEB3A